MKVFALLVLVNFFGILKAQTDTSYYAIIMNDGDHVYGKILELKKDEYVKLLKTDSSVYTIAWNMFRDYKKLNGPPPPEPMAEPGKTDEQLAKEKAELQERKQREKEEKEKLKDQNELRKAAKKHDKWYSAILVIKKDTFHIKVKPKGDYVSYGQSLGRGITIAYSNEEELKLKPEDFFMIIVDDDSGKRKYISVWDEKLACSNLYRVLVEGKCRLLYGEVTSGGGAPMMMSNGTMMGGGGGGYQETYILYYKEVLTPLKLVAVPYISDLVYSGYSPFYYDSLLFNIHPKFRKQGETIFEDCPKLAGKLQDKNFKSAELREMIVEYNHCIGDDHAAILGKYW